MPGFLLSSCPPPSRFSLLAARPSLPPSPVCLCLPCPLRPLPSTHPLNSLSASTRPASWLGSTLSHPASFNCRLASPVFLRLTLPRSRSLSPFPPPPLPRPPPMFSSAVLPFSSLFAQHVSTPPRAITIASIDSSNFRHRQTPDPPYVRANRRYLVARVCVVYMDVRDAAVCEISIRRRAFVRVSSDRRRFTCEGDPEFVRSAKLIRTCDFFAYTSRSCTSRGVTQPLTTRSPR